MTGFIVLLKVRNELMFNDCECTVFETEQEAHDDGQMMDSGTQYAVIDLSQLQFEMVI